MGVPIQSSLVYVPCRSGSPQGVFAVKALAGAVLTAGGGIAVFGAAGGGGICAGRVWPAIEIDASAIRAASIATNVESRFIVSSLLLFQTSINQLFDSFHALEFVELRSLFFTAIEHRTVLPRPGKDLKAATLISKVDSIRWDAS